MVGMVVMRQRRAEHFSVLCMQIHRPGIALLPIDSRVGHDIVQMRVPWCMQRPVGEPEPDAGT